MRAVDLDVRRGQGVVALLTTVAYRALFAANRLPRKRCTARNADRKKIAFAMILVERPGLLLTGATAKVDCLAIGAVLRAAALLAFQAPLVISWYKVVHLIL